MDCKSVQLLCVKIYSCLNCALGGNSAINDSDTEGAHSIPNLIVIYSSQLIYVPLLGSIFQTGWYRVLFRDFLHLHRCYMYNIRARKVLVNRNLIPSPQFEEKIVAYSSLKRF